MPPTAASASTPPLEELFPFPLDEFQTQAIAALAGGHSVLVSAPTGSGKTVVAEYAVHMALARRQRVFYTTPLKALSNQKYRDLGGILGVHRVGLLTGDVTINRDAEIVVMTTEVFRNMLYGTSLGAVETNLRDVGFVILDEVHYMNDAQRGTVWEESIIYCPPAVQIVALSATVANAPDLAAWMNHVHGNTTLVSSDHRPVPLRFHYFTGSRLSPLMRKPGPMDHRARLPAPTARRPRRWEALTEPDELVQRLFDDGMLPCIYFVFSRKGCDEAMMGCVNLDLCTPDERQAIAAIVDAYHADFPSTQGHPHMPYILRGIAAHHAGLLPAWKVLVERLFQRGLIKAVFATETLAAGINMPARTTVLSSITKRSDRGHRSLTASEFLQMSGRAGRRGMDDVGHVVVVPAPHQTRDEAQRLAAAPPDPLGSHFTPTYGMVLNLLQRHTLEECEFLVSRSFGEFIEERRRAKRPRRRDGRPREDRIIVTTQWQRFLRLRDVLEHYRYLEADHPTQPGITAASFRAENEVLVAETVFDGVLDELEPDEMAAIATALVAEELRRSAVVKVRPGTRALRALQHLSRLVRDLRLCERQHRVELDTRLHSDCSGLSQLWARGTEFETLMGFTNLDEGDVVRILRRTVDLLEQVVHAPMIAPELSNVARAAVRAMDREPVREEP